MHKKYPPAERERLAAAFRSSGLKQKDFAEREGITISALQSWLYKPVNRLASELSSHDGFVRVVGARSSSPGALVLRVGESITLTFESLPEPNYLAALARALAC